MICIDTITGYDVYNGFHTAALKMCGATKFSSIQTSDEYIFDVWNIITHFGLVTPSVDIDQDQKWSK